MTTTTKPETIPMDWTKYRAAGECGCILCGRPHGSLEKDHLYVHIGCGGTSILRADLPIKDGLGGDNVIFADGSVDTGDLGWFPIGSTCAKKLGKEYVKNLPPMDADAARKA